VCASHRLLVRLYHTSLARVKSTSVTRSWQSSSPTTPDTNMIKQIDTTKSSIPRRRCPVSRYLPLREYRDTQPRTDCPTGYYHPPTNLRNTCRNFANPRHTHTHTHTEKRNFSSSLLVLFLKNKKLLFDKQDNERPANVPSNTPRPTCRTNPSGTRARARTARLPLAGMFEPEFRGGKYAVRVMLTGR
jgi:hypothetical protein